LTNWIEYGILLVEVKREVDEEMDKCKICDGRMISDFIDYKATILGVDVVIDKVDGIRCLGCGHTEVEETVLEGLKDKLLDKKLEIQKQVIKNYKPLLINNIRSVRESKRIPQKKIGEALGYSEQRFGAIERNDNTPIVTTSILIADALEVPVDDIYKVINVSKQFYDCIKNLKQIEVLGDDEEVVGIDFVPIPELIPINEQYDKVEQELLNLMEQLRYDKAEDDYWQDIKATKKEISKLEKKAGKVGLTEQEQSALENKKERVAEFQRKEAVLKINEKDEMIKNLKKKKNQILEKKRDIESLHGCVLKQSQCLDGEVFELLKEKFSKEYHTMIN
jgi:putative transcriptional regulator